MVKDKRLNKKKLKFNCHFRLQIIYSKCLFGEYGDKRARNTRIGPGGGTRRLHQTNLHLRTLGSK